VALKSLGEKCWEIKGGGQAMMLNFISIDITAAILGCSQHFSPRLLKAVPLFHHSLAVFE